MAYTPPNPNGQATSANSSPVVLASDQSAIPVSGSVTAANVTGNIAAGSADSGNPVKVGGKYNASAPTLADGQRGDLQMDTSANAKVTLATLIAGEDISNNVMAVIHKPIASASYAPSIFINSGSATTFSVKNTPGGVLAMRITNANAAVRYAQIHDKASAPAAGETAQDFFLIPAGTATAPGILLLDQSYFASEEWCPTGIGFAISTTATTYTAATNGDHTSNLRYV